MPKGDRFKLKADPDDGTTPISHMLLEAVAIANLTGIEKGIILYLWRQTYGWVVNGQRQIEATLGQDTLAAAFRVSTKSIYSSLKSLTEKKIIYRKDMGSGKGYKYRMNTHVAKWERCLDLAVLKKIAGIDAPIKGSQFLLPSTETTTLEDKVEIKKEPRNETSRVPSTETSRVPPTETTTLPPTETSGPTLYKEILNQLKKGNKLSSYQISGALAELLKALILENNPTAKVPNNLEPWSKEIDLMIRKDNRPPESIEEVVRWSQADSFWKTNIRSAESLRKHYDALFMKLKSDGGNQDGRKSYATGPHAPNPRHTTQHTPEEYERSARENNVPD